MDEKKLEIWLKILEKWVNQTTNNCNSLLYSVGNESSVLNSLKQHEQDLFDFFVLLNNWLQCQASVNISQLSLIARFISLCCKIPVILSKDLLLNGLLDLMVALSLSTDSAEKTKLCIYVTHKLRSIISLKVEEVSYFLLEEFGITQEEYLREHLFQISKVLADVLCKNKDESEEDTETNILTMHKVFDDDMIVLILEAILLKLKDSEIPKINKSMCAFPELLFCQMSLPALKTYYDINFSAFEKCVVSLVEKCQSLYPWAGSNDILECLKKTRLLELSLLDGKYAYGVKLMLKNIMYEIGMHPSLVTLVQIITSQVGETFCFECEICNMLRTLNLQDQSNDLSDGLSGFGLFIKTHSEKLKQTNFVFEVWFHLLLKKDLIDKLIVVVCNQSVNMNTSNILKIILWYFFPMETMETALVSIPMHQEPMETALRQMVSYITKLRLFLKDIYTNSSEFINHFLPVISDNEDKPKFFLFFLFFITFSFSNANFAFTLENYKLMFRLETFDFAHYFFQALDIVLNADLLFNSQKRNSCIQIVKDLKQFSQTIDDNKLINLINDRCTGIIVLLDQK